MIVRCLIVLFLFTITAHAQSQKINVALQVSMDDSEDTLVISYLNRELRSLHEIQITEEQSAKYIISVVIIKDKAFDSRDIGYSASVVVIEPLDKTAIDRLLSTYETANNTSLREFYSEFGRVAGHLVQVGGNNDLPKICSRIIATVDVKVFELYRKAVQSIQNRNRQ